MPRVRPRVPMATLAASPRTDAAWSISPVTCSNTTCATACTGTQNARTYVVGFGSTIAESADYLEDIATAGGGTAYTQTDAAGLKAAFEDILSEVAEGAELDLRLTDGRGQRVQPHAQSELAVRVGVRARQSRSLARQREEVPAR